MDYLENLLNLSMFSGDSNNENIRDLNFVYLFLVCEHNYNCVLQRCFLWMVFVFLTVLSLSIRLIIHVRTFWSNRRFNGWL